MDMGYRMLHQSQLQSQAMTLNVCPKGYFYRNTFLKHIFEALCLNFELLPNFKFELLWPSGFKQCLGAHPGLGTQPYYDAPGEIQ